MPKKANSTLVDRVLNKIFRKYFPTITSVNTSEPAIALTFDDGPHPVYTPKVLDILSKYNAHGTFFMIGKAAKAYPHIVHQVAEAGHSIGNHSWDHQVLPNLTGKERRNQIIKCKQALYPYGDKYFRPPKGYQDYLSRLDAYVLKYLVVKWEFHVEDWKNYTAKTMKARLLSRSKNGSIILLHDAIWDPEFEGADDRTQMLDALDGFMNQLYRRYQFVTIPQMIKLGSPVLKSGIKYRS